MTRFDFRVEDRHSTLESGSWIEALSTERYISGCHLSVANQVVRFGSTSFVRFSFASKRFTQLA